MSGDKIIQLERAQDGEGQLGSFGFSILGGHGTKFPACVCEVDSGGPADLSNEVHIGDRLLELNGEELKMLTPPDLVQRIRHAPSPSTFILSEDKDLQRQVVALLRKKERRVAEKARRDRKGSTGSDSSVFSSVGDKGDKKAGPEGQEGVVSDEKKKKRLDKIIEVEPSVNISNGQSAGIVQVRHNRIVGRLDSNDSTSRSTSPPSRPSPAHSSSQSGQGSPQHVSPLRESSSGEKRNIDGSGDFSSPTRSEDKLSSSDVNSPPNHLPSTSHPAHLSLDSLSTQSSSSTASGLPPGGGGGASQDHTPEHHISNTNCNSTTEQHSSQDHTPEHQLTGMQSELNGDVRMTMESTSVPREVHVSLPSEVHVSPPPSEDSTLEGGETTESEADSRTGLHIPEWNGLPSQPNGDRKIRVSLSEDILIGQLERDQENIVKEESELSRLVRKRSSKKKERENYTSAVMMARKLFMLDGYKKSQVAQKLSDRSEYGQSVAKEFLKFFEFQDQSLDVSLRQFLSSFSLTGESQERERIMIHFSQRYHECNQDQFLSSDVVHGLVVAVLLLNTDLHSDHGGKKMTFSQFSNNLQGLEVKVPKFHIKSLYDSIRKRPLEWASDGDDRTPPTTSHGDSASGSDDTERVYHVTIPGTFVEVEMPGNAPLFKEGYILKKNVMEGPHKKVPRGKRQWKPYYAYLKGFLLYLEPPRHGDLQLENTSSAISICHCLALGAFDYHKKNSVMRITTSEWQSFLFQANDTMDMQQWIAAINKAAGLYSSPALAAPISSSAVFQRPTFPLTPTKNTPALQEESHEAKVKSLTKELEEHQAYKPKGSKAKHSQLQSWFDKYEFLQFEISRYQIYSTMISSNAMMDFNTPLPSGLVPSPSISTLATAGTTDGSSELVWKSVTPPHSPQTRNKLSHNKTGSHSPLVPRTFNRQS